jgi:hypothetical protein
MTVDAFGVTTSALTGYAHRLALDASTSPTAAQADEMITDRAAEWCAQLASLGVDVATAAADPSSQVYRLSRRWIIAATLHDVIRARERTITPIVESFAAEMDALRDRVLDRVATLGDGQPTAADAPNLPASHVTLAAEVEAAVEGESLIKRLAWGGYV